MKVMRKNPDYKEKERLYNQKYRLLNGNKLRLKFASWKNRIRIEVLSAYSKGKPQCACCSEETLEFLCIDHINGGGMAHLKQLNRRGISFYVWLKKNNYPKGFQVLCHNCNLAKGFYSVCPHQGGSLLIERN